jgi:hypothetical protein
LAKYLEKNSQHFFSVDWFSLKIFNEINVIVLCQDLLTI